VCIQYPFARIQLLLRDESAEMCKDDITVLTHPTEWEIVKWYSECLIKTTDANLRNVRLFIASIIANVIKGGLNILGIDAPERS